MRSLTVYLIVVSIVSKKMKSIMRDFGEKINFDFSIHHFSDVPPIFISFHQSKQSD